MPEDDGPFSKNALPINQSGQLTQEQSRLWERIAKSRRQSVRGVAYVFAALSALLLFANGPAATAAARANGGIAFLAVAAILFVAARLEPVNADVREGRVESVEGAIAKRRSSGGRGASRSWYHYFDIAGRRVRATTRAYNAAPTAGYVRVYFFPRSRRVVNLEQLADPPIPSGSGAAQQIVQDYAHALLSFDRTAIAEASAHVVALEHVVQGPPPHATAGRDRESSSRLRVAELYGTWTNPLVTITFMKNGIATMTTALGGIREGHWSIDGNGKLLTNATGTLEPVDASLDGDRLTIVIEGNRVAFTRR